MVIDDPGDGAKLQLGGPTGLFSKALRDTAAKFDTSLLKAMGMSDRSIWAQVQDMCKQIALGETQNTVRRLRGIQVPRIQGRAVFTGPNRVELQTRNGKSVRVSADRYLLATGSSAFRLKGIPFDGRRVFDSDSIRDLSYLPSSVAITGAGIISIEYAKIFAGLGAHVTMIIRDTSFPNAMGRVGVDPEIADALKDDLVESGVELRFDTVVGQFNVPPALCNPIGIELRSNSKKKPTGETLEADMYLFAAGRMPNTGDMGLEQAGIQVDDRGRVMVDENLETSARGVYAAGDVLGPPGLASTGIEQGTAAVNAMFGDVYEGEAEQEDARKFDPKSYLSDPDRFPIGIWTSPEVSYIGLIKDRALERGIHAVEGKARYADTTRGRVSRSRGMLKLVVDAEQRDLPVIGVSIFGEDACELVHYGMELVQSKRSLRKVLEATHAAVTYHELYKVAAADIDSQLEFGVQLRMAFSMEILLKAKRAFIEAAKKSRRGVKDVANLSEDTKIPEKLTIPYSDAEDTARELGLMNPIDEGVGGPELTFSQFLEFLRQLRKGQSSSVSVRAAALV